MKRREVLLLGLILLFALLLGARNASRSFVWYDETQSINIAHGLQHDSYGRSPTTGSVFSTHDYRLKGTLKGVVRATLEDNGNSVLYNLGSPTESVGRNR